MIDSSDRQVIRNLAERVAKIAMLPVQEEKRRLWRRLNVLKPERPMVMIDQVCWNEMEIGDDLPVRTADPDCRYYEEILRQMLFQWDHFRVDMVIEPLIRVPMAIHYTSFGVDVQEEIAVLDATNSVVSHRYNNQLLVVFSASTSHTMLRSSQYSDSFTNVSGLSGQLTVKIDCSSKDARSGNADAVARDVPTPGLSLVSIAPWCHVSTTYEPWTRLNV